MKVKIDGTVIWYEQLVLESEIGVFLHNTKNCEYQCNTLNEIYREIIYIFANNNKKEKHRTMRKEEDLRETGSPWSFKMVDNTSTIPLFGRLYFLHKSVRRTIGLMNKYYGIESFTSLSSASSSAVSIEPKNDVREVGDRFEFLKRILELINFSNEQNWCFEFIFGSGFCS